MLSSFPIWPLLDHSSAPQTQSNPAEPSDVVEEPLPVDMVPPTPTITTSKPTRPQR